MLGQFYPGEPYPGDSLAIASLIASATISVGTTAATLSPSAAPLAATAGIAFSTAGVFAAARFTADTSMAVSASAALRTGARFAAAASLAFAVQSSFSPPMASVTGFAFSVRTRLRPGPRDTRVSIILNGVDVRTRTRMANLSVHDVINEQPNTCAITFDTTEPVAPQTLRVSVNLDKPVLLFNGTLQTTNASYEGKPVQTVFPCAAIDDGARAKRRRPFGTWTNVSATTVAQYLVAVFMPGFSSAHIQAGLPTISLNLDGSEGIDGAFTQIAKLIGGYFYFEDLAVYLFTDAGVVDLPDAIDNTPGRFLDQPPIRVTYDDSQLVTRYFGKGHGEQVLSDVLAGETILPVSNASAWFGTVAAGGKAISDTQRLDYTGVKAGGSGSLVGPGAGPSSPPVLTIQSGAGLGTGFYAYGYTDTSTGESLLSPLAVIQTGAAVANPTSAPVIQNTPPNGLYGSWWNPGDAIYIVVTYLNAIGETLASAASNTIIATTNFGSVACDMDAISLPISPDPAVTTKKIYVNVNGVWRATGTLSNSFANRYNLSQNQVIAGMGAAPPNSVNTTAGNQVGIAGIGVGATPTTGRKVYRTAVAATAAAALAAPLKLQQIIANNSATTGVQDATADGSLGATAPTTDTSGIAQPTGQVLAGSPTCLVAGAGAFPSSGWAQPSSGTLIRYTGVSGNTLTGIPASGPGSIAITLPFNTQIAAVAVLTGVTGITVPILKGAPINIWVQRDDIGAQAEAAARDNDGGDGVYEAPPIVDERRGEASLTALCDANLQLFSRPLATVVYATRDVKTKSGKPVVFNLASPAIHDTLTIQDVTITEIDIVPGLPPRFLVTASSVRFSLESILQKMAANL